MIQRTTRKAQPTAAGAAFHRRLVAALRDIELAEIDLRDSSAALGGILRVAASPLFAARFVVPAIAEFAAMHRELKFDLRISEAITEPSPEIDLLIRLGELAPSPMKATRVASVRRVTVAAPSYLSHHGRPAELHQLAEHACVVRAPSHEARVWTYHRDGKTLRVSVGGRIQSDNTHVVTNAVLAGMGIAVLPYWLVREAIENGKLEVVLDEYTLLPTPVNALWPAAPRVPTRVKRFVDHLRARLKRDLV